ncbi:unnamed protein product [Ilex paraguariensis]|uniref:Homologous recombination OB-fold protein OB-fold domain-containing protein n=1 Tax=Ilex paraguariensis TaxID=185542 RepID=A0ABC8UNF5_9AQUA
MPETEPWEALDVDDSDVPSLLRPCKNLHNHQTNHPQITSQSLSNSILQRCSQLPPSQPTPNLPTQTLPSLSPRLIPGPAGAVQAAMLRKARDNQSFSCSEFNPIPTQEYIRRAVENPEDDDDFKMNTWLWATEYLRSEGVVDGGVYCTPLSSIKKSEGIGKVDKVVAVIKSSTPNGLGDMMVTLKDPTGTVDASIHRRVFSELDFAKDICVGSVLILQKVAVFIPSRSARYLNISLNNLVKVLLSLFYC